MSSRSSPNAWSSASQLGSHKIKTRQFYQMKHEKLVHQSSLFGEGTSKRDVSSKNTSSIKKTKGCPFHDHMHQLPQQIDRYISRIDVLPMAIAPSIRESEFATTIELPATFAGNVSPVFAQYATAQLSKGRLSPTSRTGEIIITDRSLLTLNTTVEGTLVAHMPSNLSVSKQQDIVTTILHALQGTRYILKLCIKSKQLALTYTPDDWRT